MGDRPGHKLASFVSPKWAANNITKLTTREYGDVYSSVEIMDSFTEYYKTLYTSVSMKTEKDIREFLNITCLAWLEAEHRSVL